jgi:hypothetical protein
MNEESHTGRRLSLAPVANRKGAIAYLLGFVSGIVTLLIVAVVVTGSTVEITDSVRETDGTRYAVALSREPGDGMLNGAQYSHARFGVSVRFPDGWGVVEDTLYADTLALATSSTSSAFSRLNAGQFSDLTSGSRDDFLTALWRVQRNILEAFAINSAGIYSSEIHEIEPVASTSAASMRLITYWYMPDGSVRTYFDEYIFFGEGPQYFTLQVSSPIDELTFEQFQSLVSGIVQSIRIGNGR